MSKSCIPFKEDRASASLVAYGRGGVGRSRRRATADTSDRWSWTGSFTIGCICEGFNAIPWCVPAFCPLKNSLLCCAWPQPISRDTCKLTRIATETFWHPSATSIHTGFLHRRSSLPHPLPLSVWRCAGGALRRRRVHLAPPAACTQWRAWSSGRTCLPRRPRAAASWCCSSSRCACAGPSQLEWRLKHDNSYRKMHVCFRPRWQRCPPVTPLSGPAPFVPEQPLPTPTPAPAHSRPTITHAPRCVPTSSACPWIRP